MEELKSILRTVPDFPKKGINFIDITTLIIDPQALKRVVDHLSERYKGRGITKVIGMESRGFIFAPPVAINIGAGFVPVRKPGKLPAETISIEYELEYGTDTLEIHADALSAGDKVLIIDDLIATGGTAAAVAELVGKLGAELVEMAFVVELSFLNPREKMPDLPIYSLVTY